MLWYINLPLKQQIHKNQPATHPSTHCSTLVPMDTVPLLYCVIFSDPYSIIVRYCCRCPTLLSHLEQHTPIDRFSQLSLISWLIWHHQRHTFYYKTYIGIWYGYFLSDIVGLNVWVNDNHGHFCQVLSWKWWEQAWNTISFTFRINSGRHNSTNIWGTSGISESDTPLSSCHLGTHSITNGVD